MTPSAFLQINRRLKKEYILLFDFDDTLLDTNLANNEAYRYALWKVTGKSDYMQLANARRITRKDVAKLPDITPQMVETIVQEKRNNYLQGLFLRSCGNFLKCYRFLVVSDFIT